MFWIAHRSYCWIQKRPLESTALQREIHSMRSKVAEEQCLCTHDGCGAGPAAFPTHCAGEPGLGRPHHRGLDGLVQVVHRTVEDARRNYTPRALRSFFCVGDCCVETKITSTHTQTGVCPVITTVPVKHGQTWRYLVEYSMNVECVQAESTGGSLCCMLPLQQARGLDYNRREMVSMCGATSAFRVTRDLLLSPEVDMCANERRTNGFVCAAHTFRS